ncbi:MAG TPA: RimK family alpha-L-glutamate ligase [Candidatus Saccharimonadales bacterium]|nr:RimK family alpha-L-glutamate ligase [Candidatus Saccharimonadales bacterium]
MNICILTHGKAKFIKGSTVSTRSLYDAAVKRGHKVRVINAALCYVEVNSDKPKVWYEGEDISQAFDAIIPRIMPSLTNYATAILRQFEMLGVYTTAKSIAIVRSRDKFRAIQLLAKSKIDIPQTIFSRESAEIDDLIEKTGVPAIIKLAKGTQGKGVVLAETRKAAKSVMQAFYVLDTSILLQEYIEESAGADIRAFVVGNTVVASMRRQSLDDDFRSNLHQGGEGTPMKLTDDQAKLAVRAAKAMGLQICGVDFILSNRGPLVLEVNANPGLEGIERVTGHNVAKKIIEYVENNAKQRNRKDKVGA